MLAEVQAIQVDLPSYVVASLNGPYTDGRFFHLRVGLDRIDELFDDPPESSEQLLDHDKYREDEQPIEVALPELELDGYVINFDATMGQKDLELLLREAVDPKQAEEAAFGWGGDNLRIYAKGDEDAVWVLAYRGDSKADAAELAAAFAEYKDEMLPPSSFSLIQNNGADLLVIFASDVSLSSQLSAVFAS